MDLESTVMLFTMRWTTARNHAVTLFPDPCIKSHDWNHLLSKKSPIPERAECRKEVVGWVP